MARFPRFFEEVVGPIVGVPVPGHLDADEEEIRWTDTGVAPVEPDAGGPPVWVIHEGDEEEDVIIEIDIPPPQDIGEGAGGHEIREPSGRFSEESSPGPDVVAAYKPWHIWGEDWGIYFYASAFQDFTQSIAHLAAQSSNRVEPFVLHQLLQHEFTHFDFEVMATELEAIYERPLYRSYLFYRFRSPSRWTKPPWPPPPPPHRPFPGPVEEAVATWREVAFARKRSNPPGFQKAVRKLADAGPGGYNAWRCMRDRDRRADLVIATVASLISDQPQPAWHWSDVTEEEHAEVPLYWRGHPNLLPSSVIPKSLARPTPRALERWLRKNGAELDPAGGKGSHRKFTWRGRREGYATSRPVVPKTESQRIAKLFGLKNANALYQAIAAGRVIN